MISPGPASADALLGAATGRQLEATEDQQYTAAWKTIASDPTFYVSRLAEDLFDVRPDDRLRLLGGSAALGDPSLGGSGALITEAQIQQEITTEVGAGTAPSQMREPDLDVVKVLPPA